MTYLYLSRQRDKDNIAVFPCDLRELAAVLRDVTEEDYLTSWPRHGHGPEWRMNCAGYRPDMGTMVLDLQNGGEILTPSQLRVLGVWPGTAPVR